MKIRNGFVSNSSSSSFIVAYKDNCEICKCCGQSKDKTFYDFLARELDEDEDEDILISKEINKIKENVDNYNCNNYYGKDISEETKKKIEEFEKKFKKTIDEWNKKGYSIIEVELSNWTDIWNQLDKAKIDYKILYRDCY